ncbi:MAG: hypothetical protein Q4A07_13685, partial [Coriobacteriales bacterium]|nr:hypothetical protein [Coriobacteriales bacterium]
VALLDEPFSALDAITRIDLRNWYLDMAHELGIASLVITHDVEEAAAIGDRVYTLRGRPSRLAQVPPEAMKILSALE